jgi:hypothetical protein
MSHCFDGLSLGTALYIFGVVPHSNQGTPFPILINTDHDLVTLGEDLGDIPPHTSNVSLGSVTGLNYGTHTVQVAPQFDGNTSHYALVCHLSVLLKRVANSPIPRFFMIMQIDYVVIDTTSPSSTLPLPTVSPPVDSTSFTTTTEAATSASEPTAASSSSFNPAPPSTLGSDAAGPSSSAALAENQSQAKR